MIVPKDTQYETIFKFAKVAFQGRNRGQSLVDVIKKATDLSNGTEYPAERTFEFLLKTMVGESLTRRGKGRWFVGPKFGAAGFQEDLRDNSDQTAHAVAAMYIGFSPGLPYGTEQIIAFLTECGIITSNYEPQDTRLYAIGGSIGRRVTNENLPELASVVAKSICDKTVSIPK